MWTIHSAGCHSALFEEAVTLWWHIIIFVSKISLTVENRSMYTLAGGKKHVFIKSVLRPKRLFVLQRGLERKWEALNFVVGESASLLLLRLHHFLAKSQLHKCYLTQGLHFTNNITRLSICINLTHKFLFRPCLHPVPIPITIHHPSWQAWKSSMRSKLATLKQHCLIKRKTRTVACLWN